MSLFKHSVPFYFTAISAALTGIAVWVIKDNLYADEKSGLLPATTNTNTCKPKFQRLSGYNYVSPLLMVENQCESDELVQLKSSLVGVIEQKKAAGVLKDGAFYLRYVDTTLWTGYNENTRYNPGSLMKVPDLLNYLLMEESSPGLLDKKIFYEKPFIVQKAPVFISTELPPGKAYTVRELLKYMISYSDNNATLLLTNNLGDRTFKRVLADFRLPALRQDQKNYPLSPAEFSRFLRSIYNSSYLSLAHSELAAELLSTCDFKEGFIKGLPPGTKLIHKFGEAGNAEYKELHESAIMYINGRALLFTVMTKGNDLHQLAGVLSEMATVVYNNVKD